MNTNNHEYYLKKLFGFLEEQTLIQDYYPLCIFMLAHI